MQRDRKFYPGYVFVEMKLFDRHGMLLKDPWYKIKETDGVINFIGRIILHLFPKMKLVGYYAKFKMRLVKKFPKVQFTVGEVVKILDGPFLKSYR